MGAADRVSANSSRDAALRTRSANLNGFLWSCAQTASARGEKFGGRRRRRQVQPWVPLQKILYVVLVTRGTRVAWPLPAVLDAQDHAGRHARLWFSRMFSSRERALRAGRFQSPTWGARRHRRRRSHMYVWRQQAPVLRKPAVRPPNCVRPCALATLCGHSAAHEEPSLVLMGRVSRIRVGKRVSTFQSQLCSCQAAASVSLMVRFGRL